MEFKPNPKQVLYLWKLLVSDEEILSGQIKPMAKASERNELEKNGLIELEKKKTPKGGFAKYVTLSENGWLWVAKNMDAEIAKSYEASMILHKVLCKLKDFLKVNKNTVLANLFTPKICSDNRPSDTVEERETGDIEQMIRDAYYQLAGGKWNFRVRLCDLRLALPSVPRSELDAKLLSMQKEKKLAIYKLDDPSEITPEDDQAAIDILGTKRHIIYMEG